MFKAKVQWNDDQEVRGNIGKRMSKNHTINIDGKAELHVSAAKAFKGNPAMYNPEDLLLSSVASCHMMSYLYVCSQNGIEVLSYSDEAEATLEVNADGSGRISEIRLFPKVVISQAEKIKMALELHHKANQLCFIANSCNFPILHDPLCETA